MAGNGEEHVVEIGGVNRQLRDLHAGIIESLEYAPQRCHIAVGGQAQYQVVFAARGRRERGLGHLQRLWGCELEADMAAWDASFELCRCALGDDPAMVEDR